jgi:superfamily II RNA helicase
MKSYIQTLRTPIDIICEYTNLQENVKMSVNKKRKEIERKIQSIKDNYKFIEQDQNSHQKVAEKEQEIAALNNEYKSLETYFQSDIGKIIHLLETNGFVEQELKLTLLGKIASQFREIHCLAFAKLYQDNTLASLSAKQLVALLSCFTNLKVNDNIKDVNPETDDNLVKEVIRKIETLYYEDKDYETNNNINTGTDYSIHYDLLNYVEKWCGCEDVNDCKLIIQELAEKKEIFLGEFVKALLKINNISCELEKIAELTGNIAFLSKLKEIPNLTLKYVVTNQSLYV